MLCTGAYSMRGSSGLTAPKNAFSSFMISSSTLSSLMNPNGPSFAGLAFRGSIGRGRERPTTLLLPTASSVRAFR